jgi:hypothetical protein
MKRLSRQSNVICESAMNHISASVGSTTLIVISVRTLSITDGAQSYFPVYEPTQEELKARYRAAEGEPVVDHYDSKKEGESSVLVYVATTHLRLLRIRLFFAVRTKGAGFYQFAKDETIRAEQMENLKREREVTESVRNVTNPSPVLSAAQEAKKRKLEERRALIDSKRQKVTIVSCSGLI